MRKVDRAYFDFYPYLLGYVPDDIAGKRTLDIGRCGLGGSSVGGATTGGAMISSGSVDITGSEGAPERSNRPCSRRRSSSSGA